MNESHQIHNALVNYDEKVAKERAIDFILLDSTGFDSIHDITIQFIAEPHIFSDFWKAQWTLFIIVYYISVLNSLNELYKRAKKSRKKKKKGCW